MVNQEMFRPKICKTIFAVAETYLFVYINLLSIYVMPHAKLIVRYLKFYHMLKESANEK